MIIYEIAYFVKHSKKAIYTNTLYWDRAKAKAKANELITQPNITNVFINHSFKADDGTFQGSTNVYSVNKSGVTLDIY